MASKKELQALITLAGKVDPSLQKALSNTTKNTKNLGESMQQSAKHASRLGDVIKGTFVGSLAANAVSKLSSKLWELGTSGIDLASDLIEVQNVVDKTFGTNATQIDEWAKSAFKSFGVTELEAKNYASTLGSLMKPSGILSEDLLLMSQNITGISGDWASFRNMKPEEVFEKMKAGMIGSSEPLLDLGIDTRVAALEQYALSKGINKAYKDMTQAEQMMLRYNKIMNDSKDVVGDYADTFEDSLANQQKTFTGNLQIMSATLAEKAVPALTELYSKANKFIENIDLDLVIQNITDTADKLGHAIGWVKDNMDLLIPVMSGVTGGLIAMSVINMVIDGYKKFKLATEGVTLVQAILNATMLANPFTWVAIGIGALIAIGVALWKNWDTVKLKAEELKQAFYDKFGGLIDWWTNIWTGAQNVAKGAINGVINLINKIPGINIPTLSVEEKERRPEVKSLPKFALGGIATQASIFGEAGPEMAIPLKRSSRSYELLGQAAKLLGINLEPRVLGSPITDNTLVKGELSTNQKLNKQQLTKEQPEKARNNTAPQIIIQINGGNQQEVKTTVLSVLEEYFGDEGRLSFE